MRGYLETLEDSRPWGLLLSVSASSPVDLLISKSLSQWATSSSQLQGKSMLWTQQMYDAVYKDIVAISASLMPAQRPISEADFPQFLLGLQIPC